MPVKVDEIKDEELDSANNSRKNRRQETLDLLEDEAMDQAEISEKTGMSSSQANTVLRGLTRDKKLVRFNHERDDGRETIHYARAEDLDDSTCEKLWEEDNVTFEEEDEDEQD